MENTYLNRVRNKNYYINNPDYVIRDVEDIYKEMDKDKKDKVISIRNQKRKGIWNHKRKTKGIWNYYR